MTAGTSSLAEELCNGNVVLTWSVLDASPLTPPARDKLGLSARVRNVFVTAFLPEGFPSSVTPDYLGFQFWDTVQGLCSYVRGMLSGQAILKGVGVGQKAATPLGAIFQFFVRDMSGMLGGIVFAYFQGSEFDTCAKQWRIFADVINDIGMAVELASPMFPGLFLAMACFGSIARSMTGVAGGATRAALTQHFALNRNAADISAKEHSQETAITMVGMVLGMLITRVAADSQAVAWLVFALLTWLHVLANIRALRCLVLTSLNQPRVDALLSEFTLKGKLSSPRQMASQESLLPPPFKTPLAALGLCPHPLALQYGARLSALVAPGDVTELQRRLRAAGQQRYLVGVKAGKVLVVLHAEASAQDKLRAHVHGTKLAALLLQCGSGSELSEDAVRKVEAAASVWVEQSYQLFTGSLQEAGWNLDKVTLVRPYYSAAWPPQGAKKDQ